MNILNSISLLPYNTFGIDQRAECLIEYDSVEELRSVIADDSIPQPILHIGEGSNLLFLSDYKGTILKSRIRDLEVVDESETEVTVRVGAGWIMDDFIAEAIARGWYGIENLSLIPGQVGASAVQNIGAYGVEACECIARVHCIGLEDGRTYVYEREDCDFAYRYSVFKSRELRGKMAVTHVDYRLGKSFVPRLEYGALAACFDNVAKVTAAEVRNVVMDVRRKKLPDPKATGNAGSFFMNPVVSRSVYEAILGDYPQTPHYVVDDEHVKIPAGWMIEQCGWKGRTLGRAGVHPRQALVLVNCGGARGEEIVNLCNTIVEDVRQRFGVTLRPEVNFI